MIWVKWSWEVAMARESSVAVDKIVCYCCESSPAQPSPAQPTSRNDKFDCISSCTVPCRDSWCLRAASSWETSWSLQVGSKSWVSVATTLLLQVSRSIHTRHKNIYNLLLVSSCLWIVATCLFLGHADKDHQNLVICSGCSSINTLNISVILKRQIPCVSLSTVLVPAEVDWDACWFRLSSATGSNASINGKQQEQVLCCTMLNIVHYYFIFF